MEKQTRDGFTPNHLGWSLIQRITITSLSTLITHFISFGESSGFLEGFPHMLLCTGFYTFLCLLFKLLLSFCHLHWTLWQLFLCSFWLTLLEWISVLPRVAQVPLAITVLQLLHSFLGFLLGLSILCMTLLDEISTASTLSVVPTSDCEVFLSSFLILLLFEIPFSQC